MPFNSQRPLVNRGILVDASPCVNSPCSYNLLPVSIQHEGSSNPCQALVDYKAEGNFLDSPVAKQWGIPAIPPSSPIPVWSLAGQLISTITHTTTCVSLVVSGNHLEGIELYLLNSPGAPVILGHLWLVQHNPLSGLVWEFCVRLESVLSSVLSGCCFFSWLCVSCFLGGGSRFDRSPDRIP